MIKCKILSIQVRGADGESLTSHNGRKTTTAGARPPMTAISHKHGGLSGSHQMGSANTGRLRTPQRNTA